MCWTPRDRADAEHHGLHGEQHRRQRRRAATSATASTHRGQRRREPRAARVDLRRATGRVLGPVSGDGGHGISCDGKGPGGTARRCGRTPAHTSLVDNSVGRGSDATAVRSMRHSAERTRQWSTARRLVSMVEDMSPAVRSALGGPETPSRHVDTDVRPMWTPQTARPSVARTRPCDGARLARETSTPPRVEHQGGRRAEDAEPADQVEVLLGVDLDVHARRARRPATSPRTGGSRGRARRTRRRTAAAWPARPAGGPSPSAGRASAAGSASGGRLAARRRRRR